MKIKLARTAGFCMGVRRAVEMVLDSAKDCKGPLYTFGPLIHNPQVLQILAGKGVRILDDPSSAEPGTVVIRAHGVPPQTKQALIAAGHTIIDATCPRVLKVQTIIATYARKGYAALIVGDRNHPEVVGLLGYAGGRGYIITHPEDLDTLPSLKRAIVVAQTTQNGRLFDRIAYSIRQRFPHFKVFNTICDSTLKRQAEAGKMANGVDAVVVVGGHNSGNTRRLAQVIQHQGVPAFHIESEAELDRHALQSLRAVGLTAGASTPNWVIKKVYRALESIPRGRWQQAVYRMEQWLLLSNLYLALGAGCLSYACAILSESRPSLPSALMATCYVLSMHTLNNFIRVDAVRYNDPDKANFYSKNRLILLVLAFASGGTGLFMAFTLGLVPFLVLCAISGLGLLYKVKLIPRPLKAAGKIERISDIPGSKTVLIAVAWGVVTGLLPRLSLSLKITPTTVFVTLWASITVFVRTAFFDILDMQGDRIVGHESLPIVIGEKKTLHLLKHLLLISFAVLLVAPIMQVASTASYGLLLSVLYLAAIVKVFEQQVLLPGLRFEFLIETIFVFTAAVCAVWQLLGW